FSDDEQRFVTTVNLGAGTYSAISGDTGVVTGGRMEKELRLRPVSQTERSVHLGGDHAIGPWAIDYALQAAKATEDRPNTLTLAFRQSSMNFTYDVSDQNAPDYTVTKGSEFNSALYTYNSLRSQTRHVDDDQKSGRLNVSRPLSVGGVNFTLKA